MNQINSSSNYVYQMLASVGEKNYTKFLTFFAEDQEIFGIFPAGNSVNGYREFLESQQTWFKSKTGSFNFKIVRQIEDANMAHYGVEVDFLTPDSQRMELYIGIVLRRIDGKWQIVHIQNTIVKQ